MGTSPHPQFSAGDRFRVVRGSRAGGLGVTGTLEVERFDERVALLSLQVGKFGFRLGIRLHMERDGDDIDIVAVGRAFDEIRTRGRVVVDQDDELRIEDAGGELADLHLLVADDRSATLDAEIPGVGPVRLLLQPE